MVSNTKLDSWNIMGLPYAENTAADMVEAAAEDAGVKVYGGLGWKLYMEVRWSNLRGLWPWQRMQVTTVLLNGDENRARELLAEFGKCQSFARVTRFHPGEHYHVLGEKFDNLSEAQEYAAVQGYETGAPETIHVYDHIGD